ncbi:MAG: Glu/Leu/Phe/Val dehydrogenase dimerization domain-containing protein [Pseudomonadota bacterium]
MSVADLSKELLSTFSSFDDHEHVRRFELEEGIVAFIAVHNTNLGPALGGCRMRAYKDESEAINDVLRLSRGMTYKNAMAGLPLGGGKAVIIGDPKIDKTPALMEAMGKAVDSFEGAYITAEDSGTAEEDMVSIAKETDFVTGLPPEMLEGSKYGELGGNPSPLTALGCYHGIKAAIDFRYNGEKELKDMTVSIQGVGAVGLELAKLLHQDGAKLIICDVSEENLKAAQQEIPTAEVVDPMDIYGVEADIFAPCAMGGVLNDNTIELLKVGIIAGAANNQLLEDHHNQMLQSRNILYVPDYVINSGGVICVGYEFFRNSGYNPQDFNIQRGSMVKHVESIGKTVTEILERAEEITKPTGETADKIAEERFLKGSALNDNEEADDSAESPSSNLVQ